MKKIKIAVTGGIGSGKTSVCDFLEKKGFPVLKADLIAKEMMVNDSAIKKSIIAEFGEESYLDEKLNTKYLADNIFCNEDNVIKINEIVHAKVMQKIEMLCVDLFKKNDIVFIESALVYEANLEDFFDYTLLVLSDKKLRIERVIKREQITEEKVIARMNFQIPDEEKKDDADFVLENNSSIKDLENRTEFLLILIKQLIS